MRVHRLSCDEWTAGEGIFDDVVLFFFFFVVVVVVRRKGE